MTQVIQYVVQEPAAVSIRVDTEMGNFNTVLCKSGGTRWRSG
jgi:hypothetical protein